MTLTTTPQMRRMIETWEGCVLHAYQDDVGVWTIGYGHTGPEAEHGNKITQEQADNLLTHDLFFFENKVRALVGASPTTQQQFDALVSFAYNLGAGALAGSTLLKKHLGQFYAAAAAEFPKWDHAGGQVLPGLLQRRNGEAAVYLHGKYE